MIQVSIFIDEDDMFNGERLSDYIMHYLMRNHIDGASAFITLLGYGRKHHLHRPKNIGAADERSIMILFIDTEEKVAAVIPHLHEAVRGGLITSQKVERL